MNNIARLPTPAEKQALLEEFRRQDGRGKLAPAFSEDEMALEFAEMHADKLRYTPAFSCWRVWNGVQWKADDRLETYSLARRGCREVARHARDGGKEKDARGIASAKAVAAVITLARCDERLVAVKEQWDADILALNTQTGILDLRSCESGPHVPEAYCTSITATGADEGGNCDLWLEVLSRAMGGNPKLVSYLQRLFGYCLTGSTKEHVLAFFHGTGANSKTVILNTVAGILGDYARVAPIEVFMESKNDRHPTELAMLNGARLVTAVETEEGRRWSESKLKALTGGDPIAARFMRGDFFEFRPQFKLVIAGNHKPSLRSVDEAIRRRLHLVPFAVTIPPRERDPDLTEKLKAEWPGILSWMLAGCAEWQRVGLAPPAEVVDATKEYLQNEDAMAAWISECCERGGGEWTKTADLYASHKEWAEKNGEYCGPRKQFTSKLPAYGAHEHRKADGLGFQGLRVRRW